MRFKSQNSRIWRNVLYQTHRRSGSPPPHQAHASLSLILRAYLGGLHDAKELRHNGSHAPEMTGPGVTLRQVIKALGHDVASVGRGVHVGHDGGKNEVDTC